MSNSENVFIGETISRFEAVTGDVLAAIDACTEEQWQMPMADQDRTVGVVFHHIAWSHPFVTEWAVRVARGEGLPPMSMADIHKTNAQHARDAAGVSAEATRTLLLENAQIVRSKLEALEDADLVKSAAASFMESGQITTQQIVDYFLIGHAHGHLQEIQETLNAA